MGLVHVEKPVKKGNEIRGDVTIAGKTVDVFFRSNQIELYPSDEAYCASGILGAMKTGAESLSVKGELCPDFFNSLSTIQEIYSKWGEGYKKISIKPSRLSENRRDGERVGTFFSGGVDSFYTLLKHKEEITDIILLRGFDIFLNEKTDALYAKTSESIHKIAEGYGIGVIEIATNIRQVLDPYGDWGLLGHGVTLAASAHVLSHEFKKIYIPSSYAYDQLFPWGTHPLLDPHWSSTSLKIVHDGCEANRLDKVEAISGCNYALNHLRVCWENIENDYNCGECEKCLRTMINLHCFDALTKCSVFPKKIDLQKVSEIKLKGSEDKIFVKENLNLLEQKPGNEELCEALRVTLRESTLAKVIQPLKAPVNKALWNIPILPKVIQKVCRLAKI